jgi:hypothetical protein
MAWTEKGDARAVNDSKKLNPRTAQIITLGQCLGGNP